MKRAGAAVLLALWLPLVCAAVAIARFGDIPEAGPGAGSPDFTLLYLAGLPAAACLVLAWPPASRRARLRFPMEVAAAVVLGGLLGTVGSRFGPPGIFAGGFLAAAPLLGSALRRLRRSRPEAPRA